LGAAVLVHDHTRLDSASMDEPYHIQAAFDQVFLRTPGAVLAHPPLAKEIAGFGLCFLSTAPADPPGTEAHAFLFGNRVSVDSILAASRAPMLLFDSALVLLVFAVTRRRFGSPAGLLAAVLVAFDPNFLAHAGIVATDVPVAFFWLAGVLAWSRWLEKRSALRLLVAGLVLGAALATKFSSVYLLPTFALVAFAVRGMEAREGEKDRRLVSFGRSILRDAAGGAAAGAIALAIVVIVYWAAAGAMPEAERRAAVAAMGGPAAQRHGAAALLSSAAERFPPGSLYLAGLASVVRENAGRGGVSYLNGEVSTGSFPTYFFVAFAVKTTLAMLAGTLLAGISLLRRRLTAFDAVVWVPVAYFFFFTLTAGYNIGIRHLLPVYPFLAIAIGGVMAAVPRSIERRAGRLAAPLAVVLLGGAQIAEALAVHPHELSYFNLFGGGTEKGYHCLSDSNVDWGLDLRRLDFELRRLGARDATVAYFGGDDVYGRLRVPDFSALPVVHGRIVAMSTTLMGIGPAYYTIYGRPDLGRALSGLLKTIDQRGRLIARIGGSTRIYDLGVEEHP
jgi:hypothetical protein